MKKASNTLLLIGGILSIILVFIFGLNAFEYTNYEPSGITFDGRNIDPEILKQIAQILSVVFTIMAIAAVLNAAVAFIARFRPTKILLILNIILGIASGCIVNTVGGILGIISLNREID